MPSPKVVFAAVLGTDDKIYTIGGSTSHINNVAPFYDTVEIYDPQADTWMIPGWAESTMPTLRKELSAARGLNGRIYVIGGANGAYVNTNEEASISLPENIAPQAYIDSVTPNPAVWGESVTFVGTAVDLDGTITAFKWRSSLDGILSTSATFNSSTLSYGTHMIY
jgi:hypothetical protein